METRRLSRIENSKKNKKRKKTKRILGIAASIIIIIILGVGLWATGIYAKLMNKINDTYQEVDKSALRQDETQSNIDETMKRFTVLFAGIDLGEGREKLGQTAATSRSDALVLATVDMENGRIDLVNIPRDTLSYIDVVGYYDKITHARAFGQNIKETMVSIENLLHVPVDYYAEIDFAGFQAIVDKLGGIDIDVEANIWDYDMKYIQIKKGYQTLNGDLALKYVRARAQDSDMMRGQRQLKAIQAIFNKAKQLNNVTAISDLIDIAGDHMVHNFTSKQVNTLIMSMIGKGYSIYRHQIAGYDVMYHSVYYYYPSPKSLFAISTLLNHQLGLTAPTKNQLMNIRYANYIQPLKKKTYTKTSEKTGEQLGLTKINLSKEIPSTDDYTHLPETLDIQELLNKMSNPDSVATGLE